MNQERKRVANFIQPFRVKPGSKVRLEKDCDPAFKAGVKKKKQGVKLLTPLQPVADQRSAV